MNDNERYAAAREFLFGAEPELVVLDEAESALDRSELSDDERFALARDILFGPGAPAPSPVTYSVTTDEVPWSGPEAVAPTRECGRFSVIHDVKATSGDGVPDSLEEAAASPLAMDGQPELFAVTPAEKTGRGRKHTSHRGRSVKQKSSLTGHDGDTPELRDNDLVSDEAARSDTDNALHDQPDDSAPAPADSPSVASARKRGRFYVVHDVKATSVDAGAPPDDTLGVEPAPAADPLSPDTAAHAVISPLEDLVPLDGSPTGPAAVEPTRSPAVAREPATVVEPTPAAAVPSGSPLTRRSRRRKDKPGPPTTGRRIRLSVLDTLATATLGPRGRPLRAMLSALGIAIGIASLVTVLGIPASYEAQARIEFNAWGANMIIVAPQTDRMSGETTPLPDSAPAMVGRIWSVKSSLTVRNVPDVSVYRSDKMPVQESRGLVAMVAEGDPLGTLSTTMALGHWFDQASATLPTVVLGQNAAILLGAGLGQRIWIGGSWWAVIGVLGELPGFAGQLNSSAFLAPQWAATQWPDLPIGQILVNAYPGRVGAVSSVIAQTANPAKPSGVDVSRPTEYGTVQDYFFKTFRDLALGLGGIALLVGGIGIANTMVVSVMERRGEIGLRRALGARTGQVGLQFVLEAAIIGLFGGLFGVALGAYAVFCVTAALNVAFAIPLWVIIAGPGISMAVGIIAGLYPSIKAARQSPTVTLRAV